MSDEKKDKKSNDLPGWVIPVVSIGVVFFILVPLLIYLLGGYN